MVVGFVPNEPVLKIDNEGETNIVLADLHFGAPVFSDIETSISFIREDCDRIVKVCQDVSCSKIIIAGDVKEFIGRPSTQISNEISNCFKRIHDHSGAIIVIVRGNHDGGLASIIPENEMVSIVDDYLKIKLRAYDSDLNILITHGHKKIPLDILFDSDVIVSAHIHPGFRIYAKHVSVVVKSWVVVDIEFALNIQKTLKWIILPSFSSLINGTAINDINDDYLLEISPFPKNAELHVIDREYFLLDLTPMF